MSKTGKEQQQLQVPEGMALSIDPSPEHYPEHHAAAAAVKDKVQAAYPAAQVPSAKVFHDNRSADEQSRTPNVLARVGTPANHSGGVILITSEYADKAKSAEFSVVYAHEVGHGVMGDTFLKAGNPTGDQRVAEWYKDKPQAKECRVDHFAARFSSKEGVVETFENMGTQAGILGRLQSSVGAMMPGATHPSLSTRKEAIQRLTPEQLATPSERILFNNDCSIHDVVPPAASPKVSPADKARER